MPKSLKKTVIKRSKMSHGGGGSEKCQKSVKYYLNGPKGLWHGTGQYDLEYDTTVSECDVADAHMSKKEEFH